MLWARGWWWESTRRAMGIAVLLGAVVWTGHSSVDELCQLKCKPRCRGMA